jgi:hypothetical protein
MGGWLLWDAGHTATASRRRARGPVAAGQRRQRQLRGQAQAPARDTTAPHAPAPRGAGSRRGSGDSSGDRDSGGDVNIPGSEAYALIVPPEDPDKVHSRLGDELRPPAALLITVDNDALEITRDAEPMRRFLPGQDVSRIDSSGAANVDSGWDQRAFVIRAHYTNRSERSWRYELEAGTHLLRVSFEANAPEFGRFTLQTRYRRVSPSPAGGN